MRKKLLLSAAGALTLISGCQLYVRGAHNTAYEISKNRDDRIVYRRIRRLAEEAWAEYEAQCPGQQFSDAYMCGFIDGFTEYVDAGGDGEPPVTPPERYWKRDYQTPAGLRAIEEWFAGYRQGSQIAMASGYREYRVLPHPAFPADTVVGTTQGTTTVPVPGPASPVPGGEPVTPESSAPRSMPSVPGQPAPAGNPSVPDQTVPGGAPIPKSLPFSLNQ